MMFSLSFPGQRTIEGDAGINGVGPVIVGRVGELFEIVVIEHRIASATVRVTLAHYRSRASGFLPADTNGDYVLWLASLDAVRPGGLRH